MIINETIYANIIKNGRKNIYISEDDQQFKYPESYVINHYKKIGYKGFFSEDRFWWYSKKLIYKDLIDIKANKNNEDLFMSNMKYGSRQAEQMLYNERKIERQKQNDIMMKEGFEKYISDDLIYFYEDPAKIILNRNEFIDLLNTFNREFLFYMYEYLFDHFSEINPGNGLPDLIIYKSLKEIFFCEVKALTDTVKLHQDVWHNRLSSQSQKIVIMNIKEKN